MFSDFLSRVKTIGILTKHIFSKSVSITTKSGVKQINLKLHKYKVYCLDSSDVSESIQNFCQKSDYKDHGLTELPSKEQAVKLQSLSDNDRFGRLREFFDSFVSKNKFDHLTKKQHWHNYEVSVRKTEDFSSILSKKFGGNYGSQKIDQIAFEYSHYLYWFYGTKMFSKVYLKEVKATSQESIKPAFNSALRDVFFNMDVQSLIDYLAKTQKLSLEELPRSIVKQLSFWIENKKLLDDPSRQTQYENQLVTEVEDQIFKVASTNSDFFENIEDIDLFCHDYSSAEIPELLNNPVRELDTLLQLKSNEISDEPT